MQLVESILGNIDDPSWKNRLDAIDIDYLKLDQWEAQRNRWRKTTEKGVELALSLDRNQHLHDGDILIWDEVAGVVIVARIQLNDVMIISITDLLKCSPERILRTCIELGHALGNQHWPAVVKESQVFVPLTVDRKVMTSVMRTHGFYGIDYKFIPGAEVIPHLAPHEARRLFGGADSTPHSHLHDHGDGGHNAHSHS